jgi:hypothetical protein
VPLDAFGTPAGVVSVIDQRHAIGGLIAPHAAGLDVRTGVLWGPGASALITGTAATAPMTVSVAINHAVTRRSVADGPYLGPTTEAVATVTIGAAPGSNSRIDVVWTRQRDANSTVSPDAATVAEVGVSAGTAAVSPTKPAIPIGAEELGTVTVAAGATATNGAGVTIANTARLTVARGADVPVRTVAERNALTTFIGLTVKRLDDGGRTERWTGTAWASGSDVPVLASIAARDTYFTGNLRAGASALVAGKTHIYDGSNWRFRLTGEASGTGDASGYLSAAHGGGRTPTHWGMTQGAVADAVNYVQRLIQWDADATNVRVRAVNEDANAYMATNPMKFSWWAEF